MAESNKNFFDVLPDEVILKILGNLEGLTDRSNVAQVSHRFNRLANDTYWRRSIFISMSEIEKYSIKESARSMFVKRLMKDINTSERFEMLTIERPLAENYYSCTSRLLNKIKVNIMGLSNLLEYFSSGYSLQDTHTIAFFSPRLTNAHNGRMIQYPPVNTSSLTLEGIETIILEKILKFLIEYLRDVILHCPITLPVLKQLGECKKLECAVLNGELTLPPDLDPNTLPQINSRKLYLNQLGCSQISAQASKTAVKFFSDSLHVMYISYPLLKGSANEILPRCPNLEFLNITMRNNEDVTNEDFSDFCDKLLSSVNNHPVIRNLYFLNIGNHLVNVLYGSLRTNLTKRYNDIKFINTVSLEFPVQ